MATMGVLLRKAEAAAVGTTSRVSDQRRRFPLPSVAETNGCSAPVLSTPRAST